MTERANNNERQRWNLRWKTRYAACNRELKTENCKIIIKKEIDLFVSLEVFLNEVCHAEQKHSVAYCCVHISRTIRNGLSAHTHAQCMENHAPTI